MLFNALENLFKPRQRRLTVRMLPTSSALSATSKLYFEQFTASFLVCSLISIEYYLWVPSTSEAICVNYVSN
ncbi:hypothetical protein PNI0197_00569 [Streptococcus pneumoniae PNI0197]|nr:hypothetical protein PNI0197_00569 [Streptococcus pneumoniae PNI0197]